LPTYFDIWYQMNLIDALKAEPQRGCTYKQLLETLAVEEAEALAFAIRNPAKSITQIHNILSNAGHIIGRDTLSKHRQAKCATCTTA
jgi:NADP-dependent 3-hydroxy acid dehydrogenase YdfG